MGNVNRSPSVSRRSYLIKAGTILGVAGIAGCTDQTGSGSGSNEQNGDDGGSGGNTSELPEVEMEIGTPQGEGSPLVTLPNLFKERMEEETDGRFSVQVTTGAAYGGGEETADVLKSGGIQGASYGSEPFVRYAPQYTVTGVPFAMRDFDHVKRVFDSSVMESGLEKLKAQGNQRQLGMIYRGGRGMLGPKITSPDDLAGVKYRTPQYDFWIKIFQTLGAEVTPTPWDEVYTAMKTGLVDSLGASAGLAIGSNLYEVAEYYNVADFYVTWGGLYMNEDFYQSLPADYKELVNEVSAEVHGEVTQQVNENKDSQINDVLRDEHGMKITPHEDIDFEGMKKKVEPVLEETYSDLAISYEELKSI